MKKILFALLMCVISGCSMFENGLSDTDISSAATSDCDRGIDNSCVNAITPQTY